MRVKEECRAGTARGTGKMTGRETRSLKNFGVGHMPCMLENLGF